MALSQSSVHYRFGNNSEFKTLSFDGIHIAVDELKKSVATQEGINLDYVDFTLTNANTKRVYEGTNIIPRNSCVVVARVPRENPVKLPKISNTEKSGIIQIGFNNNGFKTGHIKQETFIKMTEQQRILHAIAQSTEKYDPSNYKKRVAMSMNAKANVDHICNKCNKLGHFPKQCPMLNFRLSTGIPSEELMETTQDDPNAMYHPSGRYVIPIMHYKARETRKLVDKVNYERSRLLNGTSLFSNANSNGEAEKPSIPDELKCPLCNDLLTEAILAPCCGESFCAMCIHDVMLKGSLTEEGSRCPTCVPSKPISADSLIPNKRVRDSVMRWKNNADYSPPHGASLTASKIASPIPLSAVVLEQKVAAASSSVIQTHEPPQAIVKLPTVNLSAMLASKRPPAPPSIAAMFMPPVAMSASNNSTATTLPPLLGHKASTSSMETVNCVDKSPTASSIEPVASTSATSITAAPPGLSETVFQHEPVYKCPIVTDPQIQADKDAMSRAWDVVFNTDEPLDIFDLHKTRTSSTDKDKDSKSKRRLSHDRDSRRDRDIRDARRRKERSRSCDRDRHGHSNRRDEEDNRRHGRSDRRRYDDRERRRDERERDRYHKEDRVSRKRTSSRSKSPIRKRQRSDSHERRHDVGLRDKKSDRSESLEKTFESQESPNMRHHHCSKSPEKRRLSHLKFPYQKRGTRSKSSDRKTHTRSRSPDDDSYPTKSVEKKPEPMEVESFTDDLLVISTKESAAVPMEVDLPASLDIGKIDSFHSSDSHFSLSDNFESERPEESQIAKNSLFCFSVKQSPSQNASLKKDDSEDDQFTNCLSLKSKKKKSKRKHRHSDDESDAEKTKRKKKKKDKRRKHSSDDESDDNRSEKKKHKKKHKKYFHDPADATDENRDKKKKKKIKKKDCGSEEFLDKKADHEKGNRSHRRRYDDEKGEKGGSGKKESLHRSSRDCRRR